MAKRTKDEMKQRMSEIITDNDELLVEILEDIEDSFETVIENVTDEYETKYNELLAKYKDRFLAGESSEPETTGAEENGASNEDGLEEVEIVEKEDIFEEVEK